MGFRNFRDYLQLSEKHQLTHLEHAEDLVWMEGYKGGKKTISYLEDVVNSLGAAAKNITMKYDGAPSLIAGRNPETGEFFVATKSFFNKTPKVNYTNEDVDKNHGHAAGLASKLKEALAYLPNSIKGGAILQGDFMYSQEDLNYTSINGEAGVLMKPNTISYFVSATSGLYKRIQQSKIGIVWHTTYSGSTLDSLSGSFKISPNDFKATRDVFARDVNIDVSQIGCTKQELSTVRTDIKNLKKALNNMDTKTIDAISEDKKLSMTIRTYINSKIRNDVAPTNNEIGNLIDFVITKYDKEKYKLKSEKGQAKKELQKAEFVKAIRGHASGIYSIFDWFYKTKLVKLDIIRKMETIKTEEQHYIQQADGSYIVTAPEGFVVSSSPSSGIKFVNRHEFSKLNFNNSTY